jgi:hypothetical protein
VQQELVQILNETTQSLSYSLASFQSILKADKPERAEFELLNVKDFVEKAKRLLSNKIIGQLANIEYSGDPNFSVKYFAPYLEDAFYTIFAHLLEQELKEDINVLISTNKEGDYEIIEVTLPISIEDTKEKNQNDSSSLLFSFPQSIELIKSQLDKYNGKLKLKSKDNFSLLLTLYFKDPG